MKSLSILHQYMWLTTILTFVHSINVFAAEGGSSNYLPGFYGEYAVAVAPEPGWSYANFNSFYSGKVDHAVLQGRVNIELDTFSYFNTSAMLYSPEEDVLGGRLMVAAFVPIGYVGLNSDIIGPIDNRSVSTNETGIGDISFIPFSWYSNSGNWHFNIYEFIVAPTAPYSTSNDLNFSRNYWSFDTVFAFTNLNMKTGTEFSLATGLIVNSENSNTNYKTGNELHIDGMLNQFFSDTFALGLHFYYYKQVRGDSGSGAILGDFKGESYGAGPSFLWVPWVDKPGFGITATWLHDFYASNRVKSDYALITLAWQFAGNR